MKRKMKKIIAFLCAVVLVATTFLGHCYMKQAKAADEVTPVELDGFDNLTISDFEGNGQHTSGTVMTAKEYEAPKCYTYAVNGITNYNKKLISMRVTFEGGGWQNSIIFGGNATYCGFNLHPSSDGSKLVIDETWAGDHIDKNAYTPLELSATTAGLDSFIGKEILLQMSFEYGEEVDGKADLTLGMYINGELYNNAEFTIAGCIMSTSGARMAFYPQTEGQNIIIGEEVKFPIKPVELDGFDNLTISDFVGDSTNTQGTIMTAKAYEAPKYWGFAADGLTNFDKKLVSMRVTYQGSGWQNSIMFGGNGLWVGFNMYPSADGSQLVVSNGTWGTSITTSSMPTLSAQTAKVTTFLNEEFLLQMSFEYVNETNGKADLKLGFYINGELYNNEVFTIANCNMSACGARIAFYPQTEGQNIIIGEEVKFPIKPVELDGFDNLTISDFVGDSTNTQGTIMTAKAYEAPKYWGFAADGLTNFDKKLVSMRVTYQGSGWQNSIMFGGNGLWVGFNMYPSTDGSQLVVSNGTWGTSITTSSMPTLSAQTAKVTSFLNEEFLLQMSFEYVNEADGKADLKLGFYINGELYNNEVFTIANCNMSACGARIAFYPQTEGQNIIIGKEVTFPVAPGEEDPFEDYTEVTVKDFVDSSGNVMEEKVYTCFDPENGTFDGFTLGNHSSFDGKVLSMNVKFKDGGAGTRIDVAGAGKWKGLMVYPTATGDKLQIVASTGYGMTDTNQSIAIDAVTADINSFLDTQFLLQLTFDFGTVNGSTNKADLTLGVYINGNLCNSENATFTGCNMGTFGNYMGLYRQSDISRIIVGSVGEEFPEDHEAILDNFEEVTVKDFVDGSGQVMEEKVYPCFDPKNGTFDGFTLANHADFNGKVLSMNVKFKEGGATTRIDVAGTKKWQGLAVYSYDAAGTILLINSGTYSMTDTAQKLEINAATAGIDSFVNKRFLLQLTFTFGTVDANNKADLSVGVFINGIFCGSKKFTGCDMSKFGNYMGLYRQSDESAIIVGSIKQQFPVDPGIQPSARYDKLTFGNFAIVDGTYSYVKQGFAAVGTATGRTTLDKTVICGDIWLKGSNSSQIVWGGTGSYGWNGLRMFPSASGTMRLAWYDSGSNIADIATLDSKTAGVDFVGEKYNIMLSSELVDNGGDSNVKDIKIGIWFNGVLYNQQYFYATDLGNKAGNGFGVYCGTETDTVTLGSVPELLTQPSEELEKVTYTQFGIEDGDYTDVKGALKTKDTVAGTVFCGDIQFTITDTTKYTYLYLGGTSDDLDGAIKLVTNNPNQFNLMWDASWIATLESAKAGVDFNGEEFNLMMSVELIDNDGNGVDDIKLGIWFNGFLYENKYFIITDKGAELGNYLVIANENATLTAIPELTKLPDKTFDKVTFSDFGLDSQVHTQAEGMVKATAKEYPTLDKVVFSGDFRLSDTGNYQIIYGGNSDWNGFRMIVNSNGTATLGWFRYNSETAKDDVQISAIINPADVGLTSFTKETFNFKISTELVDYDENGEVNDIKLAIWFNDVLYPINGNEYSVVADWDDTLKNHFSIYQATAGTNVLIRNDAEYQSNPSYFEDISSYRQDTGYTYPTLEGYVFAGWYEDANYEEFLGTDVTSGSAWAKFVEEDVLTAKPQVMVDDKGNVTSESTSLRFVTTVDSLKYKKISFYLQKKQKDGSYGGEVDAAELSGGTLNTRVVYEKLYYVGNSNIMTYKPSIFSWQAQYFKAFTLTGIPGGQDGDYDTMIKATPFWVTMDGTEVRGKTLETCVSKYEAPGTNTSTAVSYDFLGEDVMPITGYFGPYNVSEITEPLLIPDYNTDTYFKMIADLGVNIITGNNDDYASNPDLIEKQLKLGEKYGIGIFVKDSSIKNMSQTDMLAQIEKYSDSKAFIGIDLVDEPGTSKYCSQDGKNVSDYSSAATILNNNNISFYGNMFPVLDVESKWWEGILGSSAINDTDKNAYLTYINEVYSGLNPKVISYDYYPFSDTRKNSDGSYNLGLYFWNMDAIRDKARATGKPFWSFVQAGSQWNDGNTYFESNTPYYPTEGEFNWNASTALAFGAQGIQYFPLVQPKHFAYAGTSAADKKWDFERNGLIGAAGNKTEWYYYAQELNEHIAAIDSVLMKSYSEQIIAIGSAQSDTSGLSDVTTEATYGVLKSVTAANGALIGYFDYCGKTALYVVNYNYAGAQNVSLEFDAAQSITQIQKAATTETSGNSLTLNMEAGEGVLLVID